jgi:hypothetical protein
MIDADDQIDVELEFQHNYRFESCPDYNRNKVHIMKGPMNLNHRKNIVRKAKRQIKNDIKDYDIKPSGEQEVILDQYIEKICIESGWNLSHFYFEECKILDKILN